MRDDDIGDDADRDRVEESGGSAHPEPGQLPEHTEDDPHYFLTPLILSASGYMPRPIDLLPKCQSFTKLIFDRLMKLPRSVHRQNSHCQRRAKMPSA
jgi:hypothetical protein